MYSSGPGRVQLLGALGRGPGPGRQSSGSRQVV